MPPNDGVKVLRHSHRGTLRIPREDSLQHPCMVGQLPPAVARKRLERRSPIGKQLREALDRLRQHVIAGRMCQLDMEPDRVRDPGRSGRHGLPVLVEDHGELCQVSLVSADYGRARCMDLDQPSSLE
jgi:hypothetical protein